MIDVTINGQLLQMELDTATNVMIISENVAKTVPQMHTRPHSSDLRDYNQKPVPMKGTASVEVGSDNNNNKQRQQIMTDVTMNVQLIQMELDTATNVMVISEKVAKTVLQVHTKLHNYNWKPLPLQGTPSVEVCSDNNNYIKRYDFESYIVCNLDKDVTQEEYSPA